MHLTENLATHFEQVITGGNWTHANLKSVIEDITWEQASQKVGDCNRIVDLVFHLDYYVAGGIRVLEGGPLDIHDKFSFDHTIAGAAEWEAFKITFFANATKYKKLLENLEDKKMSAPYVLEKYGTYLRNILGLIEHHHYHLGQIVILKKIVQA